MTVLTVRVAASSDDADFFGGSTADLTTTVFWVNYPDTTEEDGARFLNVTIPQGATINSAKVTFRGITATNSAEGVVLIRGEAADNAATFSTYANYAARTKTTASVSWTIPVSTWNASGDNDSADITTIIQEIVNRAGWVSGNALAIYFSSNTVRQSDIRANSYDGSTTTAPLLTVDYTASAGATGFMTVGTAYWGT